MLAASSQAWLPPSRPRRLRQTYGCRLLLPGVLTGSRQPPRNPRRPTSPGLNISGFVHLPQAPNAHREVAGGNSWDALRLCLGAGLMRGVCWPYTWRGQGVYKAHRRRKQGAYKAYTRSAHGLDRAQCLHIQAIDASATGTRARVARVRAEYPSQLDYSGCWCHCCFCRGTSCYRQGRRPLRGWKRRVGKGTGRRPATPASTGPACGHAGPTADRERGS